MRKILNMRKILTGATVAASLAFIAVPAIADGYVRGGVKDVAPRCANFGGFYVGANAGWGYHDHDWSSRDSWASQFSAISDSQVSGTGDGWVGGIQGGYNFQRGCTVFGFETDFSWANIDQSHLMTDSEVGAALDSLTVSSEVKWFGTIRSRTGIVVDNLLLYVTGGAAYAQVKNTASLTNFVGAVNVRETFANTDTRWGWTAGVGTEWQFTPSISIKS